ncbi:MAG: AlkA N-terminal domain-containing protein [Burkholderiaceae bacterium]
MGIADAAGGGQRTPATPLVLAHVDPFDWPGLLGFLSKRQIPGLERIEGVCWSRLLTVNGPQGPADGWLHVAPAGKHLAVELDAGLEGHRETVAGRLRAFFDLDLDPAEPRRSLGKLMDRRPGLRMPGALDGFEVGARAVLGQQVSLAAATTLAGRVLARFGRPVAGGYAFPEPAVLARADVREIAALGMPARRAQSLRALAQALAAGDLALTPQADRDATRTALLALPGIGPWTVEYLAMRALRDRDAFPAADLVLRRAMQVSTAAQARQRAEAWRPWRAHAVLHLWTAMADQPRTPNLN